MNLDATLNHDFVIVDLGSSDAKENKFLRKFSQQITYIEIDAISNSEINNTTLHKSIKVKKGIHIERGTKVFIERNYLGCSSFLEFSEDVEAIYGLEEINREKARIDLECTTLNDILSENQLDHIDFLKVDLEGLDFDIIKSVEDKLDRINVIQAEIRFHPLYKGEKHFFEICQYLTGKGFEFINFANLDEWKLNTTNRKNFRDGRVVWGDFVFFRKLQTDEPGFVPNLMKQILVSKSLQFNSYAEYLLEVNKPHIEPGLYKEMEAQINTFGALERFFNSLFNILARTIFIYPIRKTLKYLYKRSRSHAQLKHGIP